jgi:cell division septation protein DedD
VRYAPQKLQLCLAASASSAIPGVTASAFSTTPSVAASTPAPPKPGADPVTVGQAAHDHVHQEPAMSSLGFDVAIGLGLALAFAVVRRFILDVIEPPRPSL